MFNSIHSILSTYRWSYRLICMCIYIYTSSCRHWYADIDLFSHLHSWYALTLWIDISILPWLSLESGTLTQKHINLLNVTCWNDLDNVQKKKPALFSTSTLPVQTDFAVWHVELWRIPLKFTVQIWGSPYLLAPKAICCGENPRTPCGYFR